MSMGRRLRRGREGRREREEGGEGEREGTSLRRRRTGEGLGSRQLLLADDNELEGVGFHPWHSARTGAVIQLGGLMSTPLSTQAVSATVCLSATCVNVTAELIIYRVHLRLADVLARQHSTARWDRQQDSGWKFDDGRDPWREVWLPAVLLAK